jgi:hypothetical protein
MSDENGIDLKTEVPLVSIRSRLPRGPVTWNIVYARGNRSSDDTPNPTTFGSCAIEMLGSGACRGFHQTMTREAEPAQC